MEAPTRIGFTKNSSDISHFMSFAHRLSYVCVCVCVESAGAVYVESADAMFA